MKTYVYIVLIIVFGSFIYNFISINYDESILSDHNFPYIIGLAAGLCALILALIILKYLQAKKYLDDSKSEQ